MAADLPRRRSSHASTTCSKTEVASGSQFASTNYTGIVVSDKGELEEGMTLDLPGDELCAVGGGREEGMRGRGKGNQWRFLSSLCRDSGVSMYLVSTYIP